MMGQMSSGETVFGEKYVKGKKNRVQHLPLRNHEWTGEGYMRCIILKMFSCWSVMVRSI